MTALSIALLSYSTKPRGGVVHTLGLAEAVSARSEELDRRITASAEGWTADRLGTLERNILRIGIHELEEESVPPEVAMN